MNAVLIFGHQASGKLLLKEAQISVSMYDGTVVFWLMCFIMGLC